jgi:hypothetical protein
MWGQYHFARPTAYAVRRGARAGEGVWPFILRCRLILTWPCAANRPFTLTAMRTSQRRHPPQPHEPPITAPAEGSGAPSGFPSGEPEGRRPSDLRHATHRGGVCLSDQRERKNRHGSPAGSPRGSAPRICEIARIGAVRSSTTPAARAATARGARYVRGAARPVDPACGASVSSRGPWPMPFGAAHAREQAQGRLSCGVASSPLPLFVSAPHSDAAIRGQPPVRFCRHAHIAAEASALAARTADHRTCGGVRGTGMVPRRGD